MYLILILPRNVSKKTYSRRQSARRLYTNKQTQEFIEQPAEGQGFDPPPIQQTQDFIEEPAEGQVFDPPQSRKRSRAANDGISAFTQPAVDHWALPTRVLLRRVFFLNNEKR
jgi:hypothetical protein